MSPAASAQRCFGVGAASQALAPSRAEPSVPIRRSARPSCRTFSPARSSRRYNASAAASRARIRTAPTSGSSRPLTTYIPSRSTKTERARLRCRTCSAVNSPSRDSCFHIRTLCSSLAADAVRANSRSFSSLAGVATRVIARTLAYDSRPLLRASAVRGRSSSARAARTRSRAGPILVPVRQASHSAQDPKSSFHPPRRSKSASSAIIRPSAALMLAARSAMRSPSFWSSSCSSDGEAPSARDAALSSSTVTPLFRRSFSQVVAGMITGLLLDWGHPRRMLNIAGAYSTLSDAFREQKSMPRIIRGGECGPDACIAFLARLTAIPARIPDGVDSWLQNPSMVEWDYQM